ncbi:MAG: caspase family protein [Alphaproteobacteria bacterium]|nr:caspase family protein [Alphaproteobacteria bacterium]
MSRILIAGAIVAIIAVGGIALLMLGGQRTDNGPAEFATSQDAGLVSRGPATSRVALVIGIDHYKNLGPEHQLQRAKSDAKAVAAKLEKLGYDTILDTDATREEIYLDLDKAVRKIKPGGAALFYFAGHGISVQSANYLDGANYLVPSDAPSPDQHTLSTFEYSSVPLVSIIEQFRRSGARISVAILDACRDSPYQGQNAPDAGTAASASRTGERSDFYILYSASPGQTALDRLNNGDGDPNSVFTRVLLRQLSDQVRLEDLTRSVQSSVSTLSQGTQKPIAYKGTDDRLTITGDLTSDDRRQAAPANPAVMQTHGPAPIIREVQKSVDMARTAEADGREWAHDATVANEKAKEFANQADEAKSRSEKNLPGYGSKVLDDGATYEGQMANGMPSGVGVALKPDGYIYKGEWSAAKKSGFGTYESLKTHFTYSGEWRDDKEDGAGVYRLQNNEVYEGEFHYGKPDGFGVLAGNESDPWRERVGQFNDAEASYSVEYERVNSVVYGMTKHGRLEGPAAKLDRQGHVIEQGYYEDDVRKTAG